MALKGKCRSILGIDPDAEAISLALSREIVDEAAQFAGNQIADADLIILAAPVKANLAILREIHDLHPGKAIVLDLGSTKSVITAEMARLPAQFDPIGGHPMCGKEHGGLLNADPRIFIQAPFALTPLQRSSANARMAAETLVRMLGSQPLWLDPETHDRWVACTSHLPFLIASALAASTPPESSPMIGPGFRSTARLAPSPWSVMGDILETNRENILRSVQDFSRQLNQLERYLQDGDFHQLREQIETASRNYEKLIR